MPFYKKQTNNYQSKKNIIAGRNPVTEALKAGDNIDKILLFKNASGETINTIRHKENQLNIPKRVV